MYSAKGVCEILKAAHKVPSPSFSVFLLFFVLFYLMLFETGPYYEPWLFCAL